MRVRVTLLILMSLLMIGGQQAQAQTTGDIRLNEIIRDTPNMIELYNPGETTVDLSNWSIEIIDYQNNPVLTVTLPPGTSLAPDDHLQVVGGTGTNTSAYIYVGQAMGLSGGNQIILNDAFGGPVDFLA